MKRISGPSAVTDSKGNNVFRDDDAANGIPGTIVTADWLNTIQEELCAIVEKSGSALEAANSSQIADIILGARSDVPALADFRDIEGDDVPSEPPLATASSPAGLVVCTSTAIGIIRGGHWQLLTSENFPEASWAAAVTLGNVTMVARLITDTTSGNVVIRCHRIVAGPSTVSFGITNLGRFLLFDDASISVIGVDHPVYRPTYDIHAQKTFLWGTFVDTQHFVYVQRVFQADSGTDDLETHVIWVEADVNVDYTADTTNLSESGAATPPNPVHLRHRICGGRLLGGSEKNFVALPTGWPPAGDVIRVLFIGIDDDNLEASVDDDSAYNLFNGQSSSDYSSPLKYIPLGAGKGMIGCAGENFYVFVNGDQGRVLWHCSPLPAGRPFRAPFLDACPDPTGGCFIFCADTDLLHIYQLSTLDVLTLRHSIPVSSLAARVAAANAADKHLALKGVSDARQYRLPERMTRSDKASVLYLPGLALVSRTPGWGPWIARDIPSNSMGTLGADADGRACLALLERLGSNASTLQAITLAISGVP